MVLFMLYIIFKLVLLLIKTFLKIAFMPFWLIWKILFWWVPTQPDYDKDDEFWWLYFLNCSHLQNQGTPNKRSKNRLGI